MPGSSPGDLDLLAGELVIPLGHGLCHTGLQLMAQGCQLGIFVLHFKSQLLHSPLKLSSLRRKTLQLPSMSVMEAATQ